MGVVDKDDKAIISILKNLKKNVNTIQKEDVNKNKMEF